jgi:hypothetical protein
MKAVFSLAFTLTAVGALTVMVSAQQPQIPPPVAVGGQGGGFGFGVSGTSGPWLWQHSAHNEAAELAKQYLKADKESDKRDIKQKMTDALNKAFDEHMEQQQKELEELEKQIADLRALMKKRSNAKSNIVDRRIEQLIQDADGLGWNASGPNTYRPDRYGVFAPATPKPATTRKVDDSKR